MGKTANAEQFGKLSSELRTKLEHLQRRQAGEPRLRRIVRKRRAPIGHDGIAYILVDDPLMIPNGRRHGREVAVHDLHEPLGCTIRGSMYFPKVSRMRSLRRNCSTI